jgi:hypothetical protein
MDWYTTTWLLAVYVIGTWMGYRIAIRGNYTIINETIENLRKGGYLKVKFTSSDDDNYEILKVNNND